MTHTPLPPTTTLLQAILSRRAVEATERADYYAIYDMAAGAWHLTVDKSWREINDWLEAVMSDADDLAALVGTLEDGRNDD